MKKFFNQTGMSLVQVMIAFALVGALSLVIMKLMENTRKQQKYIEVKNNEQSFLAQVGNYINNETICNAAFIGFRAGESFNVLQFNTKGEGSKFEMGKEIGNSGLLVEELSLLPNPVQMNTSGLYEVTFRIRTKRKDGDYAMAGTSKNKDFKVLAKLCEPWDFPYRDSIEYNKAKNTCTLEGKKAGVVSSWQVPEDGQQPPQGVLTCYICSPEKAVMKCGE